MKAVTVKELKNALQEQSPQELIELCLQLAKFKKDSKELLTYLLFEAHDLEAYRASVIQYIHSSFAEINTKNYFYIRKSARRILTQTKKYIRYAKDKETEVELLLAYCAALKAIEPNIFESPRLANVFQTQFNLAKKAVSNLHEDLQYDFNVAFEALLHH